MTADRTLTGVRSRTTTLPPIPREYDRLEVLYEIQTVLAQPIGIEQACDVVLPIVTRALQVRTAVLIDATPERTRALLWAASGIGSADLDEARAHARKALGYLARGDVSGPNTVSRAAVLPGGVAEQAVASRHFISLPLIVSGHVFGVFQLEGASAFDERDLLFINALANQVASALHRQHVQLELETSRTELRQANRRLTELQAIGEAALEGATLDASLAAVQRALCSIFNTDTAAVLLASPDGKTLRRRASVGLNDTSDMEVLVGAGAVGRIAATGTTMFFDDLEEVEGVSPTLQSNGIRSLLGAPMRARAQLIGVVHVASRDHRAFTHDELQLIEFAADRIGTIIDNASLYEQALDLMASLRAAIRGRDAVMDVVSHDLRNPLSVVQMAMELLPTDDPQLTKPVSLIKSSVDVMVRLISDLRDVGGIEAGHLSITTRPVDTRALVRDAIEGVQDAVAKKPIHLEARLPTGDLVLDCDRIRVIQVLTNLLSNAIKFTPERGSITISIAEAERGYVRFSVEDTGSGIPEADLPHVFDRYWQAEATAHLGTGLGLAITKGIVETHGGTISVESRIDHGSTFSFTLPLARDPLPGRTISSPANVGARVLVVDDEPNALSALASLLEDEGFVVETAPDGLRALPKVRTFAPDILIVDVEMPGLKGPDLVRKVREDLIEIPVILMTGHGDHVVATTQMELRASYIGKPLEIDALVSAIHRELAKER